MEQPTCFLALGNNYDHNIINTDVSTGIEIAAHIE
jgi:hypothetical protein